jgi:hypothetical protein
MLLCGHEIHYQLRVLMEFSKISVKDRFAIGFLLLYTLFCLPAIDAQKIDTIKISFQPHSLAPTDIKS